MGPCSFLVSRPRSASPASRQAPLNSQGSTGLSHDPATWLRKRIGLVFPSTSQRFVKLPGYPSITRRTSQQEHRCAVWHNAKYTHMVLLLVGLGVVLRCRRLVDEMPTMPAAVTLAAARRNEPSCILVQFPLRAASRLVHRDCKPPSSACVHAHPRQVTLLPAHDREPLSTVS